MSLTRAWSPRGVSAALGLYVDACGFEYEPPARVGFDDDDGGDVCCRAWADRWRAPPT